MEYRVVYFDGGNGACLGDLVEGEVVDGTLHFVVEGECRTYESRNNDGLFSSEENDVLLVPVGKHPFFPRGRTMKKV
jgi:hypothetical protein